MSLCICAKSLCTMLIDLRPFYTLTSISRWPSVTRVGLHNTVSRPPVESGGLNPALRRIGYCMFCCATCTSELLLHRVYVQYTRTCICTARTDVVFFTLIILMPELSQACKLLKLVSTMALKVHAATKFISCHWECQTEQRLKYSFNDALRKHLCGE